MTSGTIRAILNWGGGAGKPRALSGQKHTPRQGFATVDTSRQNMMDIYKPKNFLCDMLNYLKLKVLPWFWYMLTPASALFS